MRTSEDTGIGGGAGDAPKAQRRHQKKRKPYQRDYQDLLARMEERRRAAEVTVEDWRIRAGIARNTWQRIRARGRAFPAQIKAMSQALRALCRVKANAHMFELVDDDA